MRRIGGSSSTTRNIMGHNLIHVTAARNTSVLIIAEGEENSTWNIAKCAKRSTVENAFQ